MDRRDRVAVEGKWYERFDDKTMKAVVSSVDDEGEVEIEVPCVLAVCETCGGRGSHVNPSIDAHGLTAEDFAEDPDFAEDYHRGRYDVPCVECGGLRVVPAPDEDHLTDTMRQAIASAREVQALNVQDARYRRLESGCC